MYTAGSAVVSGMESICFSSFLLNPSVFSMRQRGGSLRCMNELWVRDKVYTTKSEIMVGFRERFHTLATQNDHPSLERRHTDLVKNGSKRNPGYVPQELYRNKTSNTGLGEKRQFLRSIQERATVSGTDCLVSCSF